MEAGTVLVALLSRALSVEACGTSTGKIRVCRTRVDRVLKG